MKQNKRVIFGSTMLTALVVGIISALMIFSNTPLAPPGWNTIASASNANPGSGESGVINVYIYPYQSDTSVYNNNLSEATAYAHFDSTPGLNESLEGNVPYNTQFDIVVTCRYMYEHAYNNSQWDETVVRGLMTCSDLGISTNTTMSEGTFYNSTGSASGDFAYINFYLQSASYKIDRGETINVTSFIMQYYG